MSAVLTPPSEREDPSEALPHPHRSQAQCLLQTPVLGVVVPSSVSTLEFVNSAQADKMGGVRLPT